MSFTKADIIDALQTVFDPEIPVNIWDLGLIYDISIGDDLSVNIQMTFTSGACPMMEELFEMVKAAVQNIPGVLVCNIELVWDPPWDISKMSDSAKLELDLTETGW